MTRTKMRASALILALSLFAGCARSPEAKRDKFLAKGKEFVQKQEYSRALLEFRNASQAMPKDPEPFYQMSVAALGLADIKTAVAALKKALELNPKHAAARLKMAQIMASASDETWVKEAETRIKSLIEESPGAPITPEMLNTLAAAELKLGKADDAIKTLEKSLAAAPQEMTSSVLLARANLLKNDVKGAEAVLKRAAETASNKADPRVVLGEFYLAQNKLSEAEAEFRRALTLDAKSGPALINLARLEYATGRKKQAEETFKRVSLLDSAAYKSVYALFLVEEGRQNEAVQEFEKLAAADPNDRSARTRLVAAYRTANRSADAEKVLDAALKKNGRDTDALLQRAEMFIAGGKYAQAESDLNRVLPLQRDSGEVHYIFARLHKARGNKLSYRQELSEALRLSPYLLTARLELSQHLLSGKEHRAASDILDATPASQKQLTPVLVQRNWILWASGDMAGMRKGIDQGLSRGRSADLLVQDGVWKLRAGNASNARAALEEALNINPGDIRALGALNIAYLAQKQGSMALQKVQEYAAKQPKSAPVQEFLGLMLAAHGDRQRARSAFEKAKSANPEFVRADLLLVQADVLDGKLKDAQRRLDGVLSANASNTSARLWLGNLAAMQGNPKAALEHYRQVIASDSTNAEALNNYAYLLAEVENQPTEALKYAQKAKELAPDSAEYSDTLGWILYRKGLYPLAITELERASAKQDNALWKYHLAMAYAKGGDLNRGRATLQAAMKRNPNMPEAKLALQMLGMEK